MSARREGDVAKLREAIIGFFQGQLEEAELVLPWSEQKLRGEIYDSCEVLEEISGEAGTTLRVRGEAAALNRLRERLPAVNVKAKAKKKKA